ncbi:MAG: lipopolysaccharide kinase InaA family protein [Pseudomonadota bacterium]
MISASLTCRFLDPEVSEEDVLAACSIQIDTLSAEDVVKNDKTTSVYRTRVSEVSAIVKRYNTKNIWHAVRRNFQISRARNSLISTAAFLRSGLLAPRPLAVVEQNYGPFAGQSWFVTEYLNYPTLLNYLVDESADSDLNAVLLAVNDIFTTMQQDNLSHGDMKATNVLVDQSDGLLELVLIDFDAAQRHADRGTLKKALRRDVKRFLKNWRSQPEVESRFESLFDQIQML